MNLPEERIRPLRGGTAHIFGSLLLAFDEQGRFITAVILDNQAAKPEYKHGTRNGYAHCRCEICKAGQSKRMKEYNSK